MSACIALVSGVAATLVCAQELPAQTAVARSVQAAPAVPNDNRMPAGALRNGVLELDLEARPARWEGEKSDLDPEAADPTVVEVLGFAEAGGPVTIPGPLIRVPQGTEVRIRVRNSIPEGYPIGLPMPVLREEGMASVADDVLRVRGLGAGAVTDDLLEVPRGEVAEIRYRADVPGTYFYWATPSSRDIYAWTGRDAQLAGAIIVDPEGVEPDPEERIFVITMLDQYADPDAAAPQGEFFRRAINGRSWPDTERFEYAVGDTVRWRWINAGFEFHPMHLHGFHYRLVARGWYGETETIFPEEERPLIVTEGMSPGMTFRMEWVPVRAGNWIFHCHILDHVVPAVERDEAERAHELMDVEQHALEAMGGLVLGMTITEDGPAEALDAPRQRLRLVALESLEDDGTAVRGFALEEKGARIDTPGVPGPPLLLTRGETTEITVINRLSEPTTIHWHGLELESVYDGVAGWSRTRSRVAPLIAPGDSFAVRINPPRAGTFIYHTHMDETDQLAQGMFGPLLVLGPGEPFDPEHDRVFVIGGQREGDYPMTVNGHREPPPMDFRVGETYRLRFVNISRGFGVLVDLSMNESPVRGRPVAKDGADLPEALRVEDDAEFVFNTGMTLDYLWTPAEPGDATLSVSHDFFSMPGEDVIRVTLRVR